MRVFVSLDSAAKPETLRCVVGGLAGGHVSGLQLPGLTLIAHFPANRLQLPGLRTLHSVGQAQKWLQPPLVHHHAVMSEGGLAGL